MSSANANQLSDTEELISRTRGLTVRQLHVDGKDHFSDRGIAIKKIQALIATNEDILQRCNELTSTRHSKLYQVRKVCFYSSSLHSLGLDFLTHFTSSDYFVL